MHSFGERFVGRHIEQTAGAVSPCPACFDYLAIAAEAVTDFFPAIEGKTLLDMPAGNGWIGDRFRDQGARVISADINEARSDFMQVDME